MSHDLQALPSDQKLQVSRGSSRPKDPLAVWRGRAGVEQRDPDECSLGLRCWRRPEMRLDLEAAQVEVRGLLDA